MNAVVPATMSDLWFVAGWTMVHFFWLGAITGALALVCRMLLRSTSASVRYGAALATLIVLAALPLATATWLVKYGSLKTIIVETPSPATQSSAESDSLLSLAIPSSNIAAG